MAKAPYPIIPVAGERDWLDEHPHRRILIGAIIVVAFGVIFVLGILSLVEYSFHHHTVAVQAIERAQSNPDVIQALGQPIKVGLVITGNIHMKDSNGYADLRIPIAGPNGKGIIVLYAKEISQVWQFTFLRVEIEGGAEPVDLLSPQIKQPELK